MEPTLASHTFLVYGEACFKDDAHPNCTHTEVGKRPQGKLFSLDLEHILGNEWQVQTLLKAQQLALRSTPASGMQLVQEPGPVISALRLPANQGHLQRTT